MRSKIFILSLLFSCTLIMPGLAQNANKKGIPLISSYSPSQYGNKGKVWDIHLADNGMAFFAADKGLLRFDGKNWDSFKGSLGFTRSIAAMGDSMLFTGSDMDFGIWTKDLHRNWSYTSLYPFKEEVQEENEEFWGTFVINDHVIFVSAQSLYIYISNQLTKLSAPNKFLRSFEYEGKLYLNDSEEGILVLENNTLKSFADYPKYHHFEVIGMFELDKQLFAISQGSGIFEIVNQQLIQVDHALSKTIAQSKAFSFTRINKQLMAIGSILNGVYICNTKGDIIHHINRNKGLKSNTILSLHQAAHNQLWIGLDYGIAMIDFSHPYTYVFDQAGNFGTAYSAQIIGEMMYIGTNQGLYYTSWQNLDNQSTDFSFMLIQGTEGQVWKLTTIDKQLFIGHDKGLFVLQNEKASQIGYEQGVWSIVPYKGYILAGTYNGIAVYEKSDNSWKFKKKIDFIAGSCNQIVVENDSILWVNIPTFGIIRTPLDESFTAIDRTIFPENEFVGNDLHILSDSNGIGLATDEFRYAYKNNTFHLNQADSIQTSLSPKNPLPLIFEPSHLNSDYIFYPVHNGFALENRSAVQAMNLSQQSLVILRVEAMNNSENLQLESNQQIPWQLNNLHFTFIIPNAAEAMYQYRLNDQQWSNWTADNHGMLLNLRHGKYALNIRAAIGDEIIDAQSFVFSIARPWYISWVAITIYFIFFVLVIYAIAVWQRINLRKQKKQLLVREKESLREQAEKHRQEILQLEQEQLQAENETLKKQLKSKTIDLASKARENDDKNRLLLSLKEKCSQAQENPIKSNAIWAEMHRMIENQLKEEDNTFDIQMNELHQEFFRKLKQRFPSLSNNDLRWCAYLKIGMNSKEIADLLNIQPSSSYISRSRLRKKLELNPEENLYDFLNSL